MEIRSIEAVAGLMIRGNEKKPGRCYLVFMRHAELNDDAKSIHRDGRIAGSELDDSFTVTVSMREVRSFITITLTILRSSTYALLMTQYSFRWLIDSLAINSVIGNVFVLE